MNRYRRLLLPVCLFSLTVGLASCDLLNSFFPADTTTDPATDPAASPAAQAPAAPASPAAPAASPFATLAPPAATPAKANFICASPNHVATVTWQNDQPSMTLTRADQSALLPNTGARFRTNPDNSATYEVTNQNVFYARVYPNRTCLIQVVNPANNTVTLEETGTVR